MYLKLQNDFVKKLCQRTMSSDVTVVNVISLQIVQTLCAGKVDPVDFGGFFSIVTVALDLPGFIKNQRTGVHGSPSIGKQVMPGTVVDV